MPALWIAAGLVVALLISVPGWTEDEPVEESKEQSGREVVEELKKLRAIEGSEEQIKKLINRELWRIVLGRQVREIYEKSDKALLEYIMRYVGIDSLRELQVKVHTINFRKQNGEDVCHDEDSCFARQLEILDDQSRMHEKNQQDYETKLNEIEEWVNSLNPKDDHEVERIIIEEQMPAIMEAAYLKEKGWIKDVEN